MKKPSLLLFLFISLSLLLSAGAFWYSQTMKIEASKAASFGITPPYLYFENLKPGEEAEARIRISRGDSSEEKTVTARFDGLEIADWITVIPGKTATLKSGENELYFIFKIKVPENARSKSYKSNLYFATGSASYNTGVGISLGAKTDVNISIDDGTAPAGEAKLPLADQVLVNSKLLERLQGAFILRPESHGELYYLHPQEKKIYYLADKEKIQELISDAGRGISNELLNKIPLDLNSSIGKDADNDGLSDGMEAAIGTDVSGSDTDKDGFSDQDELKNNFSPFKKDTELVYDSALASSLAGFLLFQTEKNNRLWYIDPKTEKRVLIENADNLLNVVKRYSIGISEQNYQKLFQK